MLHMLCVVKHVPMVLELHANVKGRPRKTGDLSIVLEDASVMRRTASVDGAYLSVS